MVRLLGLFLGLMIVAGSTYNSGAVSPEGNSSAVTMLIYGTGLIGFANFARRILK